LVIALLSILLGAIGLTFVVGLRAWDTGILSGGIKKEASYSLRIITEELKQATRITAAGLNSITFEADLDNNGENETISYSWSGVIGENLKRTSITITPPATVTTDLARNIQNAQFQYYNINNTLLGPPPAVTASSVRVVELTLQLQREGETLQYLVKIRPRGI
jgi:hypothetical protein